ARQAPFVVRALVLAGPGGRLARDDLHRHLALQTLVPDAEDRAHAALGQLTEARVARGTAPLDRDALEARAQRAFTGLEGRGDERRQGLAAALSSPGLRVLAARRGVRWLHGGTSARRDSALPRPRLRGPLGQVEPPGASPYRGPARSARRA